MCATECVCVRVCVCVIWSVGARQGMRVGCGSKGESWQQLLVYGSRWQLMEIIRQNVNKQAGAFVFGMSSFLWHAAAQQFAIKYIYSHSLGMAYAIKCETLLTVIGPKYRNRQLAGRIVACRVA